LRSKLVGNTVVERYSDGVEDQSVGGVKHGLGQQLVGDPEGRPKVLSIFVLLKAVAAILGEDQRSWKAVLWTDCALIEVSPVAVFLVELVL